MNRSGFSLIEVLLAMGLFLVGVTALLGLFQFGGGMENTARAHAELAPHVEPLVQKLLDEAWMLDSGGGTTRLQEFLAQPVPGAPDYKYDLIVENPKRADGLPRARLRFYRSNPERPVARLSFLLAKQVPMSRRLDS